MGLTHVTTTIRRLAGRGKGFAAEFLVDTGAIDCRAPAKALRVAGIKPEGKNVCEPADGSRVELEYGFGGWRGLAYKCYERYERFARSAILPSCKIELRSTLRFISENPALLVRAFPSTACWS